MAYTKYQGRNELIKYIHKKLSVACLLNNNDNIKKSFYINNGDNFKKSLIEIPIKYYNIFKSYYPDIVYQFQNDKILIKENL